LKNNIKNKTGFEMVEYHDFQAQDRRFEITTTEDQKSQPE